MQHGRTLDIERQYWHHSSMPFVRHDSYKPTVQHFLDQSELADRKPLKWETLWIAKDQCARGGRSVVPEFNILRNMQLRRPTLCVPGQSQFDHALQWV